LLSCAGKPADCSTPISCRWFSLAMVSSDEPMIVPYLRRPG
jgi:hypothetical protein